jgi:hypothetical protein
VGRAEGNPELEPELVLDPEITVPPSSTAGSNERQSAQNRSMHPQGVKTAFGPHMAPELEPEPELDPDPELELDPALDPLLPPLSFDAQLPIELATSSKATAEAARVGRTVPLRSRFSIFPAPIVCDSGARAT